MTDACSKPLSKHAIDAHVWIGAFAAALIGMALVYLYKFDSLTGMVGVSGLAYEKLDGQVASLRQEVDALRRTVEATKAGSGKAADPAPEAATRHR